MNEKEPQDFLSKLRQNLWVNYMLYFNLPWNVLKSTTKNTISYNLNISRAEHNQVQERVDDFAQEAMTVLDRDTSNIFKPLHLTPGQLSLFYFALEKWRGSEFKKIKTEKLAYPTYALKQTYYVDDALIEEGRLRFSKAFHGSFLWKVKEGFPLGFNVLTLNRAEISFFEFITLPHKAEEGMKNEFAHPQALISSIGVYQGGERFSVEEVSSKFVRTKQYYLLGNYASEITGNDIWLYGHNGNIHSKATGVVKAGQRIFNSAGM